MRFRRDEPFRFQFQHPIEAFFKFTTTENEAEKSTSNSGIAEIIDISPNGLKFTSPLNLPVKNARFLIEINFPINGKEIVIVGVITWKKEGTDEFIYGFKGIDETKTKNQIINALKDYAKKNIKESK